MDHIISSIGREQALADVCRELKFAVQSSGTSRVGALYVSCSDEAVQEAAEVFQRSFADELLPRLKHARRAPFRLASLGSRYEFGAVRVAEANFSCADAAGLPKTLLVKINSHVAMERAGGNVRFGRMARYGGESLFCGALYALRSASSLPFVDDLAALFHSEGLDRLALLNDHEAVDPELSPLLAAVCNARLQARSVAMDIQDFEPRSPTLYQIVHGVTLNQPGPDSELIGGVYTIDRTGGSAPDRYQGLGDDPAAYRVTFDQGRLFVTDDEVLRPREARDHRRLALERAGACSWPAAPEDPRQAGPRGDPRAELRALIASLIERAPLPAALVLLGDGLVEIRHAHRLTQSARGKEVDAAAKAALEDARRQVDQLEPETAGRLVELLLRRRV